MLAVDITKAQLINKTTGDQWKIEPLGDVLPILEAGGLFEFARQTGSLAR